MNWRVTTITLDLDDEIYAATVGSMGDQWHAFIGVGEDARSAPHLFGTVERAMLWCEDQLQGERS